MPTVAGQALRDGRWVLVSASTFACSMAAEPLPRLLTVALARALLPSAIGVSRA